MASTAARPIALSFSGSGLLLTYHLGIASHLLRSLSPLRSRITRFIGVSGGALAAAACVLLPPESLYDFVEQHAARGQAWSALMDLLQVDASTLRNAEMRSLAPRSPQSAGACGGERRVGEEAMRLRNVLYIGATQCSTGRAALFSRFDSNEQLARCLLASCTVPSSAHPFDLLRTYNTYPEMAGIVVSPTCEWDSGRSCWISDATGVQEDDAAHVSTALPQFPHGVAYVDGGLSAVAPLLPSAVRSHVITVSPISGPHGMLSPPLADAPAHLHICPLDSSFRIPFIAPAIGGMRCYLSAQNVRAFGESLGASPDVLVDWFKQGRADAERFEACRQVEDLP